MSNIAAGSYELAAMTPCDLPEDVASGYAEVMGTLVGADRIPVLYVGKQVVAGINHMILCKQTIVAPDAPEHLVKVVINCAPTTGKWSLVSIEQIL